MARQKKGMTIKLPSDLTRSEILQYIGRIGCSRPTVEELGSLSMRVVNGPAHWVFPLNDTCPWKVTSRGIERDDDSWWGPKWGEPRRWAKDTPIFVLKGDL